MKSLRESIRNTASVISDLKVILAAIGAILVYLGVDGLALGFRISKWSIEPLKSQTIPVIPLTLLAIPVVIGSSIYLGFKIKELRDRKEKFFFYVCAIWKAKKVNDLWEVTPCCNKHGIDFEEPYSGNTQNFYRCRMCRQDFPSKLVDDSKATVMSKLDNFGIKYKQFRVFNAMEKAIAYEKKLQR